MTECTWQWQAEILPVPKEVGQVGPVKWDAEARGPRGPLGPAACSRDPSDGSSGSSGMGSGSASGVLSLFASARFAYVAWKWKWFLGVSIAMGVPPNGWFIVENTIKMVWGCLERKQ